MTLDEMIRILDGGAITEPIIFNTREVAYWLRTLRDERDEARQHVEELQEKLDPENSCACSYDVPGTICGHHSPMLARAEAEVARLIAERDEARAKHIGAERVCDQIDNMRVKAEAEVARLLGLLREVRDMILKADEALADEGICVDIPDPVPAMVARIDAALATEDRTDFLRRDAEARQRGENLDGSPRRETREDTP